MDIAFSEGERERERERAEREGRREMGIYSVTFTLLTGRREMRKHSLQVRRDHVNYFILHENDAVSVQFFFFGLLCQAFTTAGSSCWLFVPFKMEEKKDYYPP